ncbi:MAG: hypothetical protein ACLTG4_08635 [Oscillospiraceae bacterium]
MATGEFAQLYDINMLGTFSFKGRRAPRFGNPIAAHRRACRRNAQRGGAVEPWRGRGHRARAAGAEKVFHKPVMANVSGFSVEDMPRTARLDAQPQVGWLEVNISCPNVHGGGAAFGASRRRPPR